MAAEPEFAADPLDQGPGRGRRRHPFLKGLFPEAFPAGADQDDDAAVLYGMLRVVQRLLRLVEVQVFRCSALRDQDDVRGLLQFDAVQLIQESAALTVRKHGIAGHGLQDLLVLRQDHVQDEIDADHSAGFFDVMAERIVLQRSRTAFRQDHAAVVRLDGRPRGAAGHDRLGAAGVSGKVVIFNIAETDPSVRLRNSSRNVDRRSVGRFPVGNAVIRIAVDAADLAESAFSGKAPVFLFALASVASQGEDEGDVLRLHAAGVQFVQKERHDLRRRHGTGNVARYDGDLLSRMHDVLQARGADRFAQGTGDLLRLRKSRRNRVRMELPDEIFLRDLHLLKTVSETVSQLHCPSVSLIIS